jgi:hypothetical protein
MNINPFKIRSLKQLMELLEEQNMPPDLAEQIQNDPLGFLREHIDTTKQNDFKKYDFDSIKQLSLTLDSDAELMEKFQENPIQFIHKTAKDSVSGSYKILRILVTSLCVLLIIIVASVLTAWFTKNSREAPTLITAVACTILGLLAGILVSLPNKNISPQKDVAKGKYV